MRKNRRIVIQDWSNICCLFMFSGYLNSSCSLGTDLFVYPRDFCPGLHLHDHRVLLGGSLRVPDRLQHHSHGHPGLPAGLQVEEATCGQEDAR